MNANGTTRWRRSASAAAAVLLIGVGYGFARFPSLPAAERSRLAARFNFEKLPLAEVASHPAYKNVRAVHPSLSRISAWISSLGAAATLADLDGDGVPNDIVHVDPRTDLVGVAPIPGTGDRYAPFALDPSPLRYAAGTMAPMGAVAGDFNEDGWPDLLVYYWGRSPVLFVRRPVGPADGPGLNAASYVPQELVDSGERWYTNGATQADLDGDGHVDLVIGNYFPDGARILDPNAGGVEVMHEGKAKALNGGRKHFLLGAGAGAGAGPLFREVSPGLGEEVMRGWTLAMGAADLDGDLLPELYLGNDFGPDRLLHNRSTPGQLRFGVLEGRRTVGVPKSCVLGFDSFKGMGVDFGDVNGDGRLDIYVSNIATAFGLMESHFLWLSTGDVGLMKSNIAPYVHGSEKLGLSRSGWGWDARLADFDNDGVFEAMQAVGFLKGTINRWPELQSLGTSNDRIVHDPRLWPSFKPGADLSGHDLNPFFVRAADGRYHDVGAEVGFTEPMVTKAIAVADVDRDGRLDFVFANQWEPSFYFHNRSPKPGAFLGLDLRLPVDSTDALLAVESGTAPAGRRGRAAVGAFARVRLPDGSEHVGCVDGGSGHSGRRSADLHFGLGAVAPGTKLDVALDWRDAGGRVRQARLRIEPGWHRVWLGAAPGAGALARFPAEGFSSPRATGRAGGVERGAAGVTDAGG